MMQHASMMALCMSCSKKNSLSFLENKLNRVTHELDVKTRAATDEDIKKKEEKIDKNPYLLQMCDFHASCRYGVHCNDVSHKVIMINNMGREIAENLVLLSVMDKGKAKSLLSYFQGDFPKAARFLIDL